jgi:hypothetical protein
MSSRNPIRASSLLPVSDYYGVKTGTGLVKIAQLGRLEELIREQLGAVHPLARRESCVEPPPPTDRHDLVHGCPHRPGSRFTTPSGGGIVVADIQDDFPSSTLTMRSAIGFV